ncbi:MAG: IS3 family transposase [Clostridiales Family XIII bacterium]|nr:IS3 family transposase [Clostridiales Family XIII bacterium]
MRPVPNRQNGGCFDRLETFGLTISRRCELLGIGRWSAYAKPKPPDPAALELEETIKRRLDYWHTQEPCSGVRKLRAHLRKEGFKAGRKLIRRYTDEMGICPVYPKPNLSRPDKGAAKAPYLLKNMSIRFPNQVWALDITYIPMGRSHMYLTAIIDWHSRYIVGWELSDTLEAAPVVSAMNDAMERYGVPAIANSDQGSQFTSDLYIELMVSAGVRRSMDGKARWVDNVVIERWFRSLKTEYIYINEYGSPRELRTGIAEYICAYNSRRPHQSLGYKTPEDVYRSAFRAPEAA